ncbi:MAG: family 78 glycoside hydrolase catalytic domain [Planctomycetota bacterium]
MSHPNPPVELRCEYRSRPLGIDTPQPRLFWRLPSAGDVRGISQRAYQILAASSPEVLSENTAELWNTGAIRSSDIYKGEIHDEHHAQPGWNKPDFDDGEWTHVQCYSDKGEKRTGKKVEPVRAVEKLQPQEITEPEPGTYIFDMGQNMVGRTRLHLAGSPGQTVTVRHAECLDEDGTLYTENLRTADQSEIDTVRQTPY